MHPDIIVCRTEHPLNAELKRKIALFCNVKPNAVIEAIDASTIYEVPLKMLQEGLDVIVLKQLQINGYAAPDLTKWNGFLEKLHHPKGKVTIGLIGKYIELQDAYKSILEAFVHAGAMNTCKVQVVNIHSEHITEANVTDKFKDLDGLLVAPGFGSRVWKERSWPFSTHVKTGCHFWHLPGYADGRDRICPERFGMETRPFHGDGSANGLSRDRTDGRTKKVKKKGGTMRLGAYPCHIDPHSLAFQVYQSAEISERHRHRWEFNK